MNKRIVTGILSFFLAAGMFYMWYSHVPPMLTRTKNSFSGEHTMMPVSGKHVRYKNQKMLLYGDGKNPDIKDENVIFTDGVWFLRSIDPTLTLSFSGPNIGGTIHGRGTIFLDIEKNVMLSIDAALFGEKTEKILPSFYLQNGENKFYDLATTDDMIPKDLWTLYKESAIKDEKDIFSGFSESEITQSIETLLKREPSKDSAGNIYFKQDTRIRTILENIKNYMKETRKEKKCGSSPIACSKFIRENIAAGAAIDPTIFAGLEEPLLMWAKKNSNTDPSLSWESIFQKYHLDVLADNKLAINMRDSSILELIGSSTSPTYEMWLYLTFIFGKENQGSPYALKIMTEMIRLGELLKSSEHKSFIIEESNRALANLKKVLEETYFDKQEGYIFVLKQNLKDEHGETLNTKIFVNDLNSLSVEIDKSTLFLEYPNFRVLRRHLIWFTCIFGKNKEYLQDIRICRSEV